MKKTTEALRDIELSLASAMEYFKDARVEYENFDADEEGAEKVIKGVEMLRQAMDQVNQYLDDEEFFNTDRL